MEYKVENYQEDQGREVVALWRASFQKAMGLERHNREPEFGQQLAFFRSYNAADISIIRNSLEQDKSPQEIIGMMVLVASCIEQLYVHVDHQKKGIGRALLQHAKKKSSTGLGLHTFVSNDGAQKFYLSQGFVESGRGYAALDDNPWANSNAELADIEYCWCP